MFGNRVYCNEPSFIVLVELTLTPTPCIYKWISFHLSILNFYTLNETGVSWKDKISDVCYLRRNGKNGSGNERSELPVADIF